MAKKIILIVLFLAVALLSVSEIRAGMKVSENLTVADQNVSSDEQPAEEAGQASQQTVPQMTEDRQTALIMDQYDTWSKAFDYGDWFYTITDLDHNGRLEVITASLQGSGLYTYAGIWEVNEDFSGIAECRDDLGEGGSYPDIITEAVNCYHDETADLYYYLFDDVARSGMAEHWHGKTVLCLHDGVVEITVICSEYELYEDPEAEPTVTYSDGNGNALTKEEFEQAVANWAIGKTMDDYAFEWKEVRAQG